MFLDTAKNGIFSVIFNFILGIGVYGNFKPELADDGSVRCYLNYYFNGNACVECPAGLFGRNCSAFCPYPLYGVLCNETCDCSNSSCHHAYGCKTTTLSSAVCPDGFFGDNCSVSCFFPQYGSLCNETCNCSNVFCHHVYGCNTTIVTTTAMKQKEEETVNKKKHIKITIVFFGISLSALLLLLIAREIYQLPHIREICGNRQVPGGTPDEDNVYNEIT
ncbi:uncharacterized protein LOC111110531 isoform X3 [Crassostrea virginica]